MGGIFNCLQQDIYSRFSKYFFNKTATDRVCPSYGKSTTVLPKNQISFDCRYYEIIKGLEINEFIAYIKLICQVFWKMKTLDLYGVSKEFI